MKPVSWPRFKFSISWIQIQNITSKLTYPPDASKIKVTSNTTPSQLANFMCHNWRIMIHHFYNRKVPRLGQRRNAGLTYSILAAISYKIVSMETHTAIPLFFHASKAPWKSFTLILSSTACDSLWMSRYCFKTSSLQFYFLLGKQSKIMRGLYGREDGER
jgi:hypothetical protein